MDFARLVRQAVTETDPDVIGFRPFQNARLVALKDRCDPASLFGLNQSIRPSRSTAVPCARLTVVNVHADRFDKKPPSSTPNPRRADMYVRVVRFTDVTAARVQELVARVEEAGGPPPGVPTSGLQLLFDEAQGTAVVVQLFDTVEDMRQGDQAFGAMDASETPGTRASVDMCELRLDRRSSA
jgi:hypothetical protein